MRTATRQSIHEADPASQVHQRSLPPGPTHVATRSTQTRASNEARAWLAVADVTPTGYRVGKFLAGQVRVATVADVRRKVTPGEVFCYWPLAKVADGLGISERQVKRGIRSLREAGVVEVRQRVRPCEASYVFRPVAAAPVPSGVPSPVPSGVPSGVPSHTEPRTEPKKNHERSSATRARVVCPKCGHDFPSGYGRKCHKCNHDPAKGKPTPDEPTPCTCGDDYRNCYAGKCLDCKGKPSAAQRDAVQQPPQAAAPPPPAETETRPPPEETEPGPNELLFRAALAKWTKGKRRRTTA